MFYQLLIKNHNITIQTILKQNGSIFEMMEMKISLNILTNVMNIYMKVYAVAEKYTFTVRKDYHGVPLLSLRISCNMGFVAQNDGILMRCSHMFHQNARQ